MSAVLQSGEAREPNIRAVRLKLLAALLLGALTLAGGAPAGASAARRSSPAPRTAPPPSARARLALSPARPRLAGNERGKRAARRPTVTAVLEGLLDSSQISEATFAADEAVYVAAKRTLAVLTGVRKGELAAVLANVQGMAGAGWLSASRLPQAFLTIERNREVWSGPALPGADAHVSFPGSELVWEYYPGQGVQIQWLATFGEGNGFYGNHESSDLRKLLAEAIPLAAQRAGGIAWEYTFEFDGGTPPWTSGLSQGTAIQVLARAWSRLHETAYLTAAQQALHLFEQPPPQGVRVSQPAGALYAEYTYAPSDRILNGFIQALVGLYDYASITHESAAQQLFEAGDAEARAIVPLYDTGAWSRYDQFGESDLNYHELLAEFLQHLCERTAKGEPLQPEGPIAADAVYCTTAQAFTEDLHTAPVISLLSKTLRGGTRAGVQLSLSKVALVQLTVREGARVVRSVAATVEGGRPRLLWVTPRKGGSFSAEVTATDLAGNTASTSGTILVTRAPSPKKHR